MVPILTKGADGGLSPHMNLRSRIIPVGHLFSLIVVLVVLNPSVGNAGGEGKPTLHELRPCGPDFLPGPLRFLLFQGCAGADYRPICRRHDACYETPGSNQLICDRIMFEELKAASRSSKRPMQAMYRAHLAYFGVRSCGWIAWRMHQKAARVSVEQ